MSINRDLFEFVYQNCLKIVNTSADLNIRKKEEKLVRSYNELCVKADPELQEFYSIVHELRLYNYLSILGLKPIASDDTKAGPDFSSEIGYIECVNATKGAVGTPERLYLDNKLKGSMNRYEAALPRLSGSIWDKSRKYKSYLKNKVISPDKPCIIALSTSIFSNEFHSASNLDLLLLILYGISYRTITYNLATNQFIKEQAETHAYLSESVKQPQKTSLPLDFFANSEYEHISGIILNNNSIGEDLDKKYFCLFLNPYAKNPINTNMLAEITYFAYDGIDEQYIKYKWFNN